MKDGREVCWGKRAGGDDMRAAAEEEALVSRIHLQVLTERLHGLRCAHTPARKERQRARSKSSSSGWQRNAQGWLSPWQSYFAFLVDGLGHLVFTFDSVYSIATAPLEYLYALVLYSLLFVTLAVATATLQFLSLSGITNHLRKVLAEKTDGLSFVNAVAPSIYGKISQPVVASAREKLAKGPLFLRGNGESLEPISSRVIDLDIVKTCLLMSSILYCRINAKVVEAAQVVSNDPEKAKALLKEAEARIITQAQFWGLEFLGVVDFRVQAGTFAGIFYDKVNQWMVLAFKGTDPTDSFEFLVDAKLSKIDARRYLWGQLHEGFYGSLFPDAVDPNSLQATTQPYTQILRCLWHVAGNLRQKDEKPEGYPRERVPLYLTGHSLGAAIASTLYTRFLKRPEDLGPDIALADLHGFGTPLTGDHDYYMNAEGSLIDRTRYSLNINDGSIADSRGFFSPPPPTSYGPDDQTTAAIFLGSRMWRWTDHKDIVATIPPGIGAQSHFTSRLSTDNLLNYAAPGTEFVLAPQDGDGPQVHRREKSSSDHVVILNAAASTEKHSSLIVSPIARILLFLLTPYLADHFPALYYERLDRVRSGHV